MSTVLVTGASGQLGRATLRHLLRRGPTGGLVGLVRDPAKADDLARSGIELRTGDYSDYESLLRAFRGVDKLLLVPTHAFTDRSRQHLNVIAAARESGVKHVVYTPIIRKAGSRFTLIEVTEPDLATEQALQASGLTYTLLGQPVFMESFRGYLGQAAYETGVRVPAGDGKVAPVTRDDLAAAQAAVLAEPGHENRSYSLHGDAAVSFADAARIMSQISGRSVPYVPVPEDEFAKEKSARGSSLPALEFLLGWMRGINEGEWDEPSDDLQQLIGRRPTTVTEFLENDYSTARPGR